MPSDSGLRCQVQRELAFEPRVDERRIGWWWEADRHLGRRGQFLHGMAKIERIVNGPLASTTAAAVSLMVSGAARVCRCTRAGGGLVQVRD